MLPLDLHVLSLSLAFILSQDQTLRCSNCFMSLLKIPLFPGSSILLTVFILNTCTTVVYVNFSKNSSQSFLSKRGAKVRIFIFIFQIFSKVFSIYFFRKLLPERLQDIRLDLPTSSLGFYLSGFPNPSFIMSPPHLSRLRVQKYCCKTYSPNIFPTFLQLFLLSLIVNDLQMHFSPFFWLPLFLSYFSFPNSQFSILHSQKAGVFLSFRAGFSAKDAGFFSFYAYLFKTTKRESISILAGFTFDSRLS